MNNKVQEIIEFRNSFKNKPISTSHEFTKSEFVGVFLDITKNFEKFTIHIDKNNAIIYIDL